MKHTTSFNSGHRRPRRRGTTPVRKRTRSANLRPVAPGMPSLRHSQGFGRASRRRRNRKRLPYFVIAVSCAALLFIASVVWYVNRDVTVTLNGAETRVRIHSTIDQVIEAQELSLNPGDLLAVDDSVLEKDAGEPFSATLDGEKLEGDAMHETQLEGGETLEIGDGDDVYEEHDSDVTEIQPTVTLTGSGPVQYVKTYGVAGRSEVWTGKVSGKVSDPRVTKEVQNCEVVQTSVTPDGDAKLVALTFDEAPSQYTEQILDVLEEKDVPATFFLLGSSTDERRAAAKAIVDAGCQVGSAGYSNEDLAKMDRKALRDDLSRSFSSIESATGAQTTLLRAPQGSFGVEQWAQSMDLISSNVLWNVDSGDWLRPGADKIADNVLGSVGNGSIVLLTDSDGTEGQTLEALPDIIDGLKEEGYTLVTVSDLLASDGDIPDYVVSATGALPEGAVLPQVSPTAAQASDGE